MFQRFFLICTVLIVFGVTSPQAQAIAQDQLKVVLRINTIGGLCLYGACHSELLIYDDGKGFLREGPKEKLFTIDSKELIELLTLIKKTDFEDLRKNKFAGMCPTAYDLDEFTYSFLTPHGEEILDSCKNTLDEQSPLFKAIRRIQTKAHNYDGK